MSHHRLGIKYCGQEPGQDLSNVWIRIKLHITNAKLPDYPRSFPHRDTMPALQDSPILVTSFAKIRLVIFVSPLGFP